MARCRELSRSSAEQFSGKLWYRAVYIVEGIDLEHQIVSIDVPSAAPTAAVSNLFIHNAQKHAHFFSLGANISSGLTCLSKSSSDSALSSMADSLSVSFFL